MNHLVWITLIGFASGVLGTGLGGLLCSFFQIKGNKKLSFVLEFTGGLMVAVVCFDLLPEAFREGGILLAVLGIFFGVAIVVLLQNWIYGKNKFKSDNSLLKSGIFIAVGMALHNFPEGLAIGSGFSVSSSIGMSILIVIALHDVVEGACVSLPIRAGGKTASFAVRVACMSGLPTGIGAFIGAILGEVSPMITTICLSFAAGAMLYIVCGDILLQSKKLYPGRFPALGYIFGFVIGMIITMTVVGV